MAIKYYLTVSSGNYTIETTEGCGFSGSCANLACAFDDSQESVRITDKAWRNWMPILDATADEIETDGDDLSYSELIAYLQTIMTSGGGGGGGGDSGLQLGETSTTAYRGDRGKTAYNHAQLTTGNPHNVSKSDVGLGNVDNTSDLNKPVSSAMQTALSGKANSTHSHAQSDVNGLAAALDGKQDTLTAGSNITIVNNVISATGGGGGGGANWGEIGGTLSNQTDLATALNGKASSSHSHSISDVTNLQSSLDGKASSTHSHTISEITNLQTTLNGKQSTLTFDDAPTSGSSNPVKSSGVKSALDGKANSSHSHSQSEVDGLSTALAGKASSTHSHAISDVTDLQTTLNATDEQILGFRSVIAWLSSRLAIDREDTALFAQITAAASNIDDTNAANAVIALINAIGTVEHTAECGRRISEARIAYDALTDAQRALITAEEYEVLTDAEEAYSETEQEDNE